MKNVMKNQLYMWRLCFKVCPGYMLYTIFDAFRYKFMIFLEHVLCIRYILHCAEYGEPFYKAFIFVGIVAVLMFILMVPDGYFIHNLHFRCKPKLYRALKEQMFEKASMLDLNCYDDPEYYNRFVLAVSEAESSVERFLLTVKNAVQCLTSLASLGIFYLLVDWKGIIFVSVSFVLRFILSKRLNKVNYNVRMEVNPKERKRNYVNRILYLKDYAKELRMHPGVGSYLTEEFEQANEEMTAINKKASGKRLFLQFCRTYLAGDFITDVLYIAYLIYSAAVLHTVDYSSAVVLFNNQGSLRGSMNMLADLISQTHENSLYIDKIREFLAYEPVIEKETGDSVPAGIGGVSIKNLSFRYREDMPNTLNNISLDVRPGEHVAIVGYNGAGKTTLVKLLMRLYDPTEGKITYHDRSIDEYMPKEYRRRFGVVFQDFQLYGAKLHENVVMDALTDEQVANETPKITEALNRAGFGERLAALNDGLMTSVTTEFDKEGVDFSGGEGQKVAISRAFYKDADILIMDEPSSALDPIAEYELNTAMEEAAKGKTVFYISHRLSTTRNADRIIMLEKGSIIEEGTHEQLLALDGKYAAMWKVQASNYSS